MTGDGRRLFEALKKIKKTSAILPPVSDLRPPEMMMLHAVLHFYELKKLEGEPNDKHGVTISELGQFLRQTPSAVSQTVKSLEQKELVVRTLSAADRRNVYVQLTAQGRTIFLNAERQLSKKFDQLTTALGQQETEQLITLIEKMAAILDDQSAIDSVQHPAANP